MNEDRKLAQVAKDRIEKEIPEAVVNFADDESGVLIVTSEVDEDEHHEIDMAELLKKMVIALRKEQEEEKDEF